MINTTIEWTDRTFNPWTGCTKVTDGCKFCYAETFSRRSTGNIGVWGPKGTRKRTSQGYWKAPVAWNRQWVDEPDGKRSLRVFCASMADVFEGPESMPAESWPIIQEARHDLFGLMLATSNLHWQVLTKRPHNVLDMAPKAWLTNWPEHVWIGTSVEDERVVERLDHLVQIPATVRFVSAEPLIGPLDLTPWLRDLQWLIVGGESGHHARPMDFNWARSLRDQCAKAGVPLFFKQAGQHNVDGVR